jgi:hypothetical protein
MKEMKELIKIIEKDKLYFYCDIFEKIDNHMKNHPDYLEKTKNGHNGYIYSNNPSWGKDNFCFYILNDDNEKVDISQSFSKKKEKTIDVLKKKEVLKAFRSTILEEIQEFKKGFIPNITKCAITGVILENNFYEVDHHNHDFAVIVELFLKKYNRTYNDLYKYVFQHETKRYFNNKDLRIYFIKFHNENTTLRFTSKNANRSKKREKL